MGLVIVMFGLYFAEHIDAKMDGRPVIIMVMLLMFASIGFLVLETFLAFFVYMVYLIFLFRIFKIMHLFN